MLKQAILSSAVLALSLIACGPKLEPQEPCNFVMNSSSQRVSWKDQTPIVMYLHRSVPAQYHAAIQEAMNSWNRSLGRPILSIGGIVDGDGNPGRDGVSVIYWMQGWDSDRRDEQARTTIYWVGAQIREADIRVNDRDFDYSVGVLTASTVDLKSLILHELGHVLGLAHTHDSKSVMAERLANGIDRSSPTSEDVSSLRCEY